MEDDHLLTVEESSGYLDVRYRGWSKLDPTIYHDKDLVSRILHLDLSYNNLQSLPGEIENLRLLKSLNCSSNRITHLPTTIGRLKLLTTLKATSNQLQRIPDEVGTCTRLHSLILCDNSIQILPDSLSNCINLSTLDLQNNNLIQLPHTLAQLKELGSLHLIDVSGNPNLSMIPELMRNNAAVILWILSIHHNHSLEVDSIRQKIKQLGRLVGYHDGRIADTKQRIQALLEEKSRLIQERESIRWFLAVRDKVNLWRLALRSWWMQCLNLFERRASRVGPLHFNE